MPERRRHKLRPIAMGLPRSAGCSNRHRETGRFEPATISCRGPASKPTTVIDQVSAMTVTRRAAMTVTRRAAMTVTRRVRPDSFGSRALLTGPRKLTHCDHRYQGLKVAGTARALSDRQRQIYYSGSEAPQCRALRPPPADQMSAHPLVRRHANRSSSAGVMSIMRASGTTIVGLVLMATALNAAAARKPAVKPAALAPPARAADWSPGGPSRPCPGKGRWAPVARLT